MGFPYIAQTQQEFDARAANTHHRTAFLCIQCIQSIFIVVTHVGLFLLVARHQRLRSRTFALLCAVAVPDLLFGLYLFIVVVALALGRDEPVPFGFGDHGFHGHAG